MIQPLKIKDQIIIQSMKKDLRDVNQSAQLHPHRENNYSEEFLKLRNTMIDSIISEHLP